MSHLFSSFESIASIYFLVVVNFVNQNKAQNNNENCFDY